MWDDKNVKSRPTIIFLAENVGRYFKNDKDTIFLNYGYPQFLRTDRGPQFRGEFRSFCNNANIIHHRTSPRNPESNGHSEAGVKQAKYLICKVGYGKEFKSALLGIGEILHQGMENPRLQWLCLVVPFDTNYQ